MASQGSISIPQWKEPATAVADKVLKRAEVSKVSYAQTGTEGNEYEGHFRASHPG